MIMFSSTISPDRRSARLTTREEVRRVKIATVGTVVPLLSVLKTK
jgi:hypothetical protein